MWRFNYRIINISVVCSFSRLRGLGLELGRGWSGGGCAGWEEALSCGGMTDMERLLINRGAYDPCTLYKLMKYDLCDPAWTLLMWEKWDTPCITCSDPTEPQNYSRMIMSVGGTRHAGSKRVAHLKEFSKYNERKSKQALEFDEVFHLVSNVHFIVWWTKEHQHVYQPQISCSFVSESCLSLQNMKFCC